jgi:hypothetical protein
VTNKKVRPNLSPGGSRLKIKENEMVELKCVVHEAKPKAHIVWFRENSEFVTGKKKLARFVI